jgi:hypothetical protein
VRPDTDNQNVEAKKERGALMSDISSAVGQSDRATAVACYEDIFAIERAPLAERATLPTPYEMAAALRDAAAGAAIRA